MGHKGETCRSVAEPEANDATQVACSAAVAWIRGWARWPAGLLAWRGLRDRVVGVELLAAQRGFANTVDRWPHVRPVLRARRILDGWKAERRGGRPGGCGHRGPRLRHRQLDHDRLRRRHRTVAE